MNIVKQKLNRIIRGIKYIHFDLKYGSWYLGAKLKHFGLGNDLYGWHPAQSSDYHALSRLFSQISIRPDDVIVDVGCGRGRVFNYLLNQGIKNKLIGVDVDVEIALRTRKRLKKYNQVEIHIGNIEEENSLPTGTIYYLFNPFTDRIVKKFGQVILDKIKNNEFNKNDRPIIIYYNCKALDVFENDSWKITKIDSVSHSGLKSAIIQPSILRRKQYNIFS